MDFDAAFLTRLKQRDPDTCTFLVSTMSPVLEARLRYKLRNHDAIEDIRNETFYRVFRLVDGGRIREPEQLGSFVRGVCDRVAHESRRKNHYHEPLAAAVHEPADCQPHPDQILLDSERKSLLWHAVMRLPAADRRLIVELHRDGRDRSEMARERGIGTTGLNVRLCRALKRLRIQMTQQTTGLEPSRRPCRPAPHVMRPASRGAKGSRKPAKRNGWATMAA